MTNPAVTLCRTCRDADPGLQGAVAAAIQDAGLTADLNGVDCMSGCKRPQTIAIRQTGKTAYLFGEFTRDDIPGLITFLKLYRDSPDGNLEDARPLGALRMKAIARIPG